VCVERRSELAAQVIYEGLRRGRSEGQQAAHLSITVAEELTVYVLKARWKLLRQRLQRIGAVGRHYASVLGWNPNTWRLHLHVVTIGSRFVHHSQIRRHAREVGLGHTDVRSIRRSTADRARLARYLGRNLLDFQHAPETSGDERLRPVDFSRGWPGGNLTRPAWVDDAATRQFVIAGFSSDGTPYLRGISGTDAAERLLKRRRTGPGPRS
jgi:hypothetical protein